MRRLTTASALFALLLAGPSVAQETPCVAGMAGEFACSNVDLLARLPLNATPLFFQSSSDIWGWTDPETGIEYAIINQYDHTAFVDLSTPTAPFVVARLDAPSEAVARDAKVYADHAFIGTDSGFSPVQVFDLTRLRDVTSPPVDLEADALYTDGTDPHNIALNEATGFAYLVFTGSGVCDSGLHIVDVQNPTNPTFAGCFTYPGDEFHDLQCLTYAGPDPDHQGSEVCLGSSGGGGQLTIVDVTDKDDLSLIAEVPYPNAAYAHQGWLTEDGRYFLLSDEFDESSFNVNTRTLVFDVSDLDDPTFAFAYDHPTTSTDHNLFVRGDYAYQANYTSGLRILDMSQIEDESITEAAYFDTHPEGDPTGFDGAFGVYPYFASGIVIVSDMARGLFVLRPELPGAAPIEEEPVASDGLALEVYPNPVSENATVELRVGSPQRVKLAVYDALGRAITTLHDGDVGADRTLRVPLDISRLPAGSYVVRATGETSSTSQVVTRAR